MYYNTLTEKIYDTMSECEEDLKKILSVDPKHIMLNMRNRITWDMLNYEAQERLKSAYHTERICGTTIYVDVKDRNELNNKKFIHIHLSTNYVGTDEDYYECVDINISDEEIEHEFKTYVYSHYSDYVYIVDDCEYESEEEKEEAEQEFEAECFENSYWEYTTLETYLENT